MVFFIVGDKKIEGKDTDTILSVKKKVISELGLSCKYIDISFVMDKPSRILGKFNVEPGKAPKTFDRYPLERFAFKEEVNISYTEVEDYDPDAPRKPLIMSRGRGRGRGLGPGFLETQGRSLSQFDHSVIRQEMKTEPTFSLDSQEDFPSL